MAADMFYNENIIALIGPGCTYALDPVGRLAAYWNIPIVTGDIIAVFFSIFQYNCKKRI